MPTIQVRDLPDEVYAELKSRAAAEHRSLSQETIVLLRDALGVSSTRRAERKALLERIAERALEPPAHLAPSDELIREDRDR